MSSNIYTIPAGTSLVIPAPALSSVCFQPGATGSLTASYGPDGLAPVLQTIPQSGNTSPFSFNPSTYSGYGAFSPNPMGNLGKIQVQANTVAGVVVVSDLQQYPGSFPERQTVAMSGVAYTMPNSTSELNLFSMRFHPSFLKSNFRLEWEAQGTVSNNVNVKTLKAYFGPSTNSATAGALEGGTAVWSNVYTSMAGFRASGTLYGRNDNQNVIASNPGLLSAGGQGSSVTANVTVATANYSGSAAVEQVFALTGTKATGADTFTLDAVIVRVYQ